MSIRRQRIPSYHKTEGWRSFQYSLAPENAYNALEQKIKSMIADAMKIASAKASSSSFSAPSSPSLTNSQGSSSSQDDWDNNLAWAQEAALLEQR